VAKTTADISPKVGWSRLSGRQQSTWLTADGEKRGNASEQPVGAG
jgi:hypothetical protein